MTDKDIIAVANLYLAGNAPKEIAVTIGRSYTFVINAKNKAHDRGLLPPKKKTPVRRSVRWFVRDSGSKQGTVGDVLVGLSEDQRRWLMRETAKLGCESVAEYLLELARDAHAEQTQEKTE